MTKQHGITYVHATVVHAVVDLLWFAHNYFDAMGYR